MASCTHYIILAAVLASLGVSRADGPKDTDCVEYVVRLDGLDMVQIRYRGRANSNVTHELLNSYKFKKKESS